MEQCTVTNMEGIIMILSYTSVWFAGYSFAKMQK